MRIGYGFDVHKLVENRLLCLGGEAIPYDKGLLGHSDADVLIHAIMDALLGAAALGDIGVNFPDTDNTYKDISSLILLEKVSALLKSNDYQIVNIDATIVAEKPKLMNYIPKMRENISKVLKLSIDQVNIKATTTEGLGFEGRGEGISSSAVCIINKNL